MYGEAHSGNLRAALLATCVVAACTSVRAADSTQSYEAEPVVVTASRLPTLYSHATRSIEVMTRKEIESAPVYSVADLLDYVAGVDARHRGPFGVQTDVGIRGSTFNEVLVLVDGVKVTDPQTGHHALDLPLSLDDVERIEVLRGPGSELFGPNAFGGVINIITRHRQSTGAEVRFAGGQHGLLYADGVARYRTGTVTQRLSLSRIQSSGYRPDTDFGTVTGGYRIDLPVKSGTYDASVDVSDRKFGASDFYAGAPNEWEHTKTLFVTTGADLIVGPFSVTPRASWRRHTDDYIFDRTNPSLYENRHTTDVGRGEFQANVHDLLGETAFGGEAGIERIASTNLGNHHRMSGGAFLQQRMKPTNRLVVSVGAFEYGYQHEGWHLSPGADAGYRLTDRLRVRASVGRSFRVPTYTELYYSDPANVGNPNLKPETSWSYELGAGWTSGAVHVDADVFQRDGHNLIDYGRNADSLRWEAHNITDVTSRGFDVSTSMNPRRLFGWPVTSIRIGYSYLNASKSQSAFLISKYVLAYPRHQAVLSVDHRLPFGVDVGWRARYLDPVGAKAYFVVDVKVSRSYRRYTAFVQGDNLFGASYAGAPASDGVGVPQPGRWISGGISAAWGGSAE